MKNSLLDLKHAFVRVFGSVPIKVKGVLGSF